MSSKTSTEKAPSLAALQELTMSDESYGNWAPPGVTSSRKVAYAMAMAFAHSGRFNPRGLENHTYGPWTLILSDLVSHHALIVPQFSFDTTSDGKPIEPNTSIETTAVPSTKELVPDFTAIYLHPKLRRGIKAFKLDSTARVSATLPAGYSSNPYTRLRYPPGYRSTTLDDLTFISPPIDGLNWHLLKISRAQALVIAELKKPGPRTAKTVDEFASVMHRRTVEAQVDADMQWKHVFKSQPKTKKLVVLACCGEWWSWRIIDSEMLEPPAEEPPFFTSFFNPELEGEEEDEVVTSNNADTDLSDGLYSSDSDSDFNSGSDDSFDELKLAAGDYEVIKQHHLPANARPKRAAAVEASKNLVDPRDLALSAADFVPYRQRGPSKPQKRRGTKNPPRVRYVNLSQVLNKEIGWEDFKENVEEAMPRGNEWSGLILLGTAASNQRFYLIDRILSEMISAI